jgi:hypothetical protein
MIRKKSAKSRRRASLAAPVEGGSSNARKADKDEAGVKQKIEDLRRLEKWAFRPRHGKTDVHKYLKGVYNACDWADRKEALQFGQQVAKAYDIDTRKNKSPIRIVIDASSEEDDRQVKSRWGQAVEYAVAKRARQEAFMNFLKKRGGVSGCAKRMAGLRKKGETGRKAKAGRNDDWD